MSGIGCSGQRDLHPGFQRERHDSQRKSIISIGGCKLSKWLGYHPLSIERPRSSWCDSGHSIRQPTMHRSTLRHILLICGRTGRGICLSGPFLQWEFFIFQLTASPEQGYIRLSFFRLSEALRRILSHKRAGNRSRRLRQSRFLPSLHSTALHWDTRISGRSVSLTAFTWNLLHLLSCYSLIYWIKLW